MILGARSPINRQLVTLTWLLSIYLLSGQPKYWRRISVHQENVRKSFLWHKTASICFIHCPSHIHHQNINLTFHHLPHCYHLIIIHGLHCSASHLNQSSLQFLHFTANFIILLPFIIRHSLLPKARKVMTPKQFFYVFS